MSKILVTGGRGLLGRALVPYLSVSGHDVHTCSREDLRMAADLRDQAATFAVLDEIAPSVIVNLAANTNVDGCERDPHAAYQQNTRIVENLAAWIQQGGGTAHLVQVSTDQVYDGHGGSREDDVVLGNYYAFSKFAGELAAAAVGATTLRTNFFGRSRCAFRISLSDWVVRSLRRGDEIVVFDDVYFSPLHMPTLVGIIGMAVDARPRGVFNAASREGMSKADFAFALADVLGLPVSTMIRGSARGRAMPARRPTDMRMDPSQLEKVMGLAMPTLNDEITRAAAEYADEAM